MYKIEITDLAESDLERIGDYIAIKLSNPSAAIHIVSGIREKIYSLKEKPKMYAFDEDKSLAQLGIRKIYYENYKAYYIVDEITHKVIIIRILHMLVDSRNLLYRMFRL